MQHLLTPVLGPISCACRVDTPERVHASRKTNAKKHVVPKHSAADDFFRKMEIDTRQPPLPLDIVPNRIASDNRGTQDGLAKQETVYTKDGGRLKTKSASEARASPTSTAAEKTNMLASIMEEASARRGDPSRSTPSAQASTPSPPLPSPRSPPPPHWRSSSSVR